MQKLCMIIVGAVILAATLADSAQAIPAFKKQFEEKYVKGNKNEAYVKTFKGAKCFLCHDTMKLDDKGKTSKKNRNAYGQQLSKLLDKKTDKKNSKKIQEALVKVAEMHSDAKDDKSPTFGQLIEKGKLPGGPVPNPLPK